MGDMSEVFKEIRKRNWERRERNRTAADPDGWTQHTSYHWSRTLCGRRLDYWPSRNKFQYDGRVMTGDVRQFIRKRENIC